MIDATTLPSPPAQPLTNSDSESDTLRFIYECSGANDPHLYSMRASAYTQILYAHGLQSYAYSLTQGRMVDLREFGDDSLNVIFNVILPIVEGQKSLLLSRQPKRDIYPTTQDDRDIEAARYASDLLRWLDQTLCVEEVAAAAPATAVTTTCIDARGVCAPCCRKRRDRGGHTAAPVFLRNPSSQSGGRCRERRDGPWRLW